MLRRRSIRLRIIVLVLVPVVGLLGLYAEVLSLTVGKVLTLRQEASIRDLVALPVADVQKQLANERGDALQYLARPGRGDLRLLLKQGDKTDKAIIEFSAAVQRALASGPVPKERNAFLAWQAQLTKVQDLRHSVVNIALTRIEAADAYSRILDGGDNVLNQAIIPVLSGPLGIQAADLLTMAKAAQALGEESDLVRADLIAGSFPPEDLVLVNQLAVQHQEQTAQTLPDLNPVLRSYFTTMIPQSAVGRLGAMESSISAGPATASQITLRAWTSAETSYRGGFRAALLKATKTLAQQAMSQAKDLVINLLIIAGVGLVAILAAILVGIILGRGLIRQLSDLRESAVKLSSDQLPSAISRRGPARTSESAPRYRSSSRAATRSARCARRSTRRPGPRSAPRWTRSRSGRASTTSSAASPGGTSHCSPGNCSCSTRWNAGSTTPRSLPTCSASTT